MTEREEMKQMEKIAQEIGYLVLRRLQEFAKAGQTGMITVDVQMSKGAATGINVTVKENRRVG